MPSAYCGECEWEHRVDESESDDEDAAVELSRAMIDHFVETGHSPVERGEADERLEAEKPIETAERIEAEEQFADRIDQ